MLELSQIITYLSVLTVAAAIPGPGMTALVARSINGGYLSGFSMLLGLIVGDLIYLSLVVFGFALIAQQFGTVFSLVKWGATLYLCYLAWQSWHAGYQSLDFAGTSGKKALAASWLSGLVITLSNPKTMTFYLALLPLVIDIDTVSLMSWGGILVPLTILVLLSVGALFIVGSVSLRHILTTRKAQFYLYRGSALVMFSAAMTMAFRRT